MAIRGGTSLRQAIIAAGGTGQRMNSLMPKQFMLLGGKPLLMHTMLAFQQADPQIELMVVLPENQFDYWQELCRQFDFRVPHRLTTGGRTRFESVKNALAVMDQEGLIAVHDGARPFVSKALIDRCFQTAATQGAAIPVIPLIESLRRVYKNGSKAENRQAYRIVQTPQVFYAAWIHRAYQHVPPGEYTDDAAVLEADGREIQLVEGDRLNIKITDSLDWQMAEWLLQQTASASGHF